MNETQKKIISTVLVNFSVSTVPVTEEKIAQAVDLYDKNGQALFGAAPLTEEERSEVIAALHASLLVRIDRGHCVKEREHVPWYIAAKAGQDMPFWDRYRLFLQKEQHWNADIVNELDRTTDDIMDLLGNPLSSEDYSRKGLCIGDVQSGKTSTYIGLINKAADAHYRVIILLTGTIEKLRRQTQKRIDEGFIGFDSYAFTLERDTIQVGVGEIDPNTSGWAVTSTTSDFNAATAKKIVGQLSTIAVPVIFVLKKNKSVLEKLERWLRVYNANKITKKIELPLLLIDDEADNASVNTKAEDVTAINKCIRKLLMLFSKSNYVGFTATPYANIFIDPDTDQEMLENDLFPRDFIYALEAPSNYIGARSMFGENAPYGYMLESNDDCEQALPIRHKKDERMGYIPQSLKEAIAAFFICNAVRNLRGDDRTHRTMMINVSRFIAVQDHIAKIIDQYVRNIQREVRNYYLLGEEALKYDSFQLIKKVYDKYYSNNVYNPQFKDLKHFTWDQIQKVLSPSISRIEVRSVNGGNAPKNLDYEKYEDTGLCLIAIGGLSLSRGLTLEGLCVSYFYRNSSMYDTLMQMGRWFGYRGRYRDLCKVWMPEESMSWYSYISMATDKLRDEVKRMQNADMTPKDFGLAVRSDIQGLFVTAKNKMRTAKDYETSVNISGEVVETRYVTAINNVLQLNLTATEELISLLRRKYEIHEKDPGLALEHVQFLNVEKEIIIDYLSTYSVHPLNIDFNVTELVNMFKEDTQRVFEKWDIVIAKGRSSEPIVSFGGFSLPLVKRGFAYREDTKSLQMSGKNSRLGSKNLAKGGLTPDVVNKMEKGFNGRINENSYFRTGMQRNPLLVIYPLKLSCTQGKDGVVDEAKKRIAENIPSPVIGLSLGIPLIKGKKMEKIKYKVNKQRWYELFGVDEFDDWNEIDETISEEK